MFMAELQMEGCTERKALHQLQKFSMTHGFAGDA